jgi:hypothetical protein
MHFSRWDGRSVQNPRWKSESLYLVVTQVAAIWLVPLLCILQVLAYKPRGSQSYCSVGMEPYYKSRRPHPSTSSQIINHLKSKLQTAFLNKLPIRQTKSGKYSRDLRDSIQLQHLTSVQRTLFKWIRLLNKTYSGQSPLARPYERGT